jgi:uncharacterized membrane protein YgaE (UPF0421/DUF939 family)
LAGEFIARIFLRWSEAWREALASALGAALSWFLAERLLRHPQPIFAAISAIVCLSPGLPSHTKQAGGLLLGVATGIVIGELTTALPDNIPLLKIALAAFLAMIVAASYGQSAVVPIQVGVSAMLVVAFGSATTGSVRMADVAVGAAVGFLFSQALSAVDQNRQGRLIGIGCRRRGTARSSFSATGTDCRKREPFAAIQTRCRALDTYLRRNVKRLRGHNAR